MSRNREDPIPHIETGQLTLRNLKLKKGALDKFQLPVDVLEGARTDALYVDHRLDDLLDVRSSGQIPVISSLDESR